jgi:5-methylcytosine-specific restriction endonuclease McrA
LRQRQYYSENNARFKEYYRQYKLTHSEERRRYDKQRLTKEERREYQRQYRAEHAEKLRDYDRRYNVEKAEKKAAISHKRRARKKAAEGTFTEAEWEALKRKYHYKCLCCGKGEPEIRLEPDHVVPLSKGGSNWISNIQPLCKRCNDRKKTQEIDYRSKQK